MGGQVKVYGGIVDTRDFAYDVALGRIEGWTSFRKFGYNDDIDAGTEDVWSTGGVKTWQTTAHVPILVSTSSADAADSSGSRVVVIEGVDASGSAIQNSVIMNGVTSVTASSAFYRVHRMYHTSAGSAGLNVGVITCRTSGNVEATIPIGLGQTQQTHFTVPVGYTLLIDDYAVSYGKETAGDQAVALGQIRLFGSNAWRTISAITGYEGVWTNDKSVTLVPQRTDLRVQVASDFTNLEVNVVYAGFLVDNTKL